MSPVPMRPGTRLLVATALAAVSLAAVPHHAFAQTTVFSDGFGTDQGWALNPNGTDAATTGRWQRGNPDPTSSGGITLQLDNCAGNTPTCLVTGTAAGTSAGANDIDGGVTSIQSPAIVLPSGSSTLSFNYYLAHLNNSAGDDFFRLRIVRADATSVVVFTEAGTALGDAAAWSAQTVDLSSFAGQTIRIRLEAGDNGTGSLLEAAVDDVKITAGGGGCTAAKSLSVRAVNGEYTKSGVFVQQGASVTVTATGTWTHGTSTVGPGGTSTTSGKCRLGQLVARVGVFGNTQCLTGSNTFVADASGHLFLWQWRAGSGSSGSLSATLSGGNSCPTTPAELPARPLADPNVFATRCNPPFTFHNEDPAGAQVFLNEVPDVQAWYRDVARKVCSHLYKTAAEARPADSVDLFLRNCPGVAAKWGDRDINVEICTPHLQRVKNQGRRVTDEVTGIMTHESTHGFQWDDKPDSNPPIWIIEGIADSVRLKADFISPDFLRTGGSYTSSYKTTAFFLVWLERQYPEFLYRINQSLRIDGQAWSTESFRTITGKSVDTLWSEYQAYLNGKV
jgi:hypothetical protein